MAAAAAKTMRVLGIDPGSRRTGLGVVEANGDELRAVAWECIAADAVDDDGGDGNGSTLPARLGAIHLGVREMIAQYQPQVVAVEQVFFAYNAKSALVLGQARGSAVCAAVLAGLPVAEYSALQIKRAVVGAGAADKVQVQHMVRVLLGLRAAPGADEADALACAICHIHTTQVARKMAAAL